MNKIHTKTLLRLLLPVLCFRMKLARWTRDWEHYWKMAERIQAIVGLKGKVRIHPNEAVECIYNRYDTLSWEQKNEFWKNTKP